VEGNEKKKRGTLMKKKASPSTGKKGNARIIRGGEEPKEKMKKALGGNSWGRKKRPGRPKRWRPRKKKKDLDGKKRKRNPARFRQEHALRGEGALLLEETKEEEKGTRFLEEKKKGAPPLSTRTKRRARK